jgi:segregation and condensation protein A
MRELNIAVAGEFLVMASTLTHIKSRMLLPSYDSSQAEDDEDDPRVDLVAQLKEHMRYKAAAERLEDRAWLDRDVFSRQSGREEVEQAAAAVDQPEEISAGLFDLIAAFRELMATRGQRWNLALPSAGVSMEQRMTQLLEMLRGQDTATFGELFADQASRGDLVVTFLALLELSRVGLIRIYQDRQASAEGQPFWGTLRVYFNPGAGEEDGQA